MLGIKQVVILVNKFDLVNYDLKVFDRIQKEYSEFLKKINLPSVGFVPVCARDGDNIVKKADWNAAKNM